MENYIVLGPTPGDEHCACVGEEDYEPRARKECRRFIGLLRKKFGLEPEGARLTMKSFPHDFGLYYEVVVCFDEDFPDSVDYAFRCEDNLPATWEG
jgi:hypothetical protein